jgi:hypothetical protein
MHADGAEDNFSADTNPVLRPWDIKAGERTEIQAHKGSLGEAGSVQLHDNHNTRHQDHSHRIPDRD